MQLRRLFILPGRHLRPLSSVDVRVDAASKLQRLRTPNFFIHPADAEGLTGPEAVERAAESQDFSSAQVRVLVTLATAEHAFRIVSPFVHLEAAHSAVQIMPNYSAVLTFGNGNEGDIGGYTHEPEPELCFKYREGFSGSDTPPEYYASVAHDVVTHEAGHVILSRAKGWHGGHSVSEALCDILALYAASRLQDVRNHVATTTSDLRTQSNLLSRFGDQLRPELPVRDAVQPTSTIKTPPKYAEAEKLTTVLYRAFAELVELDGTDRSERIRIAAEELTKVAFGALISLPTERVTPEAFLRAVLDRASGLLRTHLQQAIDRLALQPVPSLASAFSNLRVAIPDGDDTAGLERVVSEIMNVQPVQVSCKKIKGRLPKDSRRRTLWTIDFDTTDDRRGRLLVQSDGRLITAHIC